MMPPKRVFLSNLGNARAMISNAAVLALLVAATPHAPARADNTGESPLRLTIAFTGDVSGYLEPCG